MMANTITVYKLNEAGEEIWRYKARLLERRANAVRLEAYFDREAVDLGPVIFRQGDRFVETFYSDRWYNVFSVYDRETDAHKGWYCNLSRPAQIEQHAVRCEDLALDVWIAVDGESYLLDEDEFAALAISEEDRSKTRAALQEILRLAEQRALPQ